METSIQTQEQVQLGIWGKAKALFTKIFFGKKARRNTIVTLFFLILIGYVYYEYFGAGAATATTYEYATVTRKDIQKTVEGSGTVASVSELDIQQLQNGGKVTSVNVVPGDYVKQGQIIATLDNRQALIQLQQAKANYSKVMNGGNTDADLAVAKQAITNANLSYNIVKEQQDTAVATAFRNLLNTSIAAVPVYSSLVQANTPTISGSYTCTQDASYDIKYTNSQYASVSSVGDLAVTPQVKISNVPQALGSCGLYVSFDLTKDYSNGEWTVTLPNQIATNYSSNLTAYNNALQARDIALQNASTTVVNAQLAYNQKIAPPLPADVESAKASLASANLNYDNTIIRAPFDGQIGEVSAAVGQQTNSQAGVATIITKDKIAQISLNEIDIVNVQLGQDVELTFDAIPGETFMGKVAQIDTVGQTTSNVVTFATKISIPNADVRIKSGMSVTANIIVNKKSDILTVPSATIKTETVDGVTKSYVLKKVGGGGTGFPRNPAWANATDTASTTTNFAMNGSSTASSTHAFRRRGSTAAISGDNIKVYVTTGISDDIDTEIVDGLNEGDMVVSKTVTGTATTKSTTAAFSLFGGGAVRGAGGGGFGGGGGGTRTGATAAPAAAGR